MVATPATGYHFVNWTSAGVEVSTSATYQFEVSGAGNYVANFAINTYEITAVANPTAGGTVTGAGTYEHFATCTLTATPAIGYHFVNWTKGGEAYSTDLTVSFEVTQAEEFVANFEINSYEIAAVANNAQFGSVTGAGTYNHFETCTLVATPATGYHFVNWTKGEEVSSTEPTVSFEVTQAESFVANFEINTYAITAVADPNVGGSVTGAGTYNHFETCVLTATANTGYTFVNWTRNGAEVSTDNSISFEVNSAADYVANFSLNSYAITAIASPTVGGTITGAGTYNHFDTCTLVATANTGYTFINWTKNNVEVSTETTISFEVDGATAYVANFSLNSYAITTTANPAAGGSVTGSGTYNHFETCVLTATANTGYTFVNWTLDGQIVTTNTTYAFMVENAGNYVANFETISYEIIATMNPTDAGTITGAGTYYHYDICTLTATPTDNYLFINWTRNGTVVSTEPTISFEVTGPASYVANFVPNTYEITTSVTPSYAGSVSGSGTYYYNNQCTLTATANYGFHFVNWTKDGVAVSTDAEYTFVVVETALYVANFASNQYSVVTMSSPVEGGTTTGDGTYIYGATCVLTATANEGYHFINWTDEDDNELSSNFAYLFNVTDNAIIIAHFGLNTFNISATANPIEGGNVEGAGMYDYGEPCTLIATSAEGYTFVNWTLDNVEVSTSASYTFNVIGDASYVANFTLDSYEITAISNPNEGGSVAGVGVYYFGQSCTLTATASEGFSFVNWTKNNVVVSFDASFIFTVTENANFTANFEEIIINTYEVTVTTNPDGYGTVTGEGTYVEGETCTITATPTSGHIFVNWTENGNIVSEDAVYSFTVTENHNFVANFDHDNVNEISDIQLVMYPNPAIDKVIIESSVQIRKCEVYAINGALVYTLNECSKTFEINVRHYKPGNYVIRLISDSFIQTKSLIKE